jgi:hypothetical protein
MPEPLRIKVGEHHLALALARELEGMTVAVRRSGHAWEVSIDGVQTNGLVSSALDAVRRTLGGQSSASAEVILDGHTYMMHGP